MTNLSRNALLQDFIEEGEQIVITWLWNSTHKADLSGFAASNNVIQMAGATLYTYEHDLLIGHWQITDRLGVYQQLKT